MDTRCEEGAPAGCLDPQLSPSGHNDLDGGCLSHGQPSLSALSCRSS